MSLGPMKNYMKNRENNNIISHSSLLVKVLYVASKVYNVDMCDWEGCDRFSESEIKALKDLHE